MLMTNSRWQDKHRDPERVSKAAFSSEQRSQSIFPCPVGSDANVLDGIPAVLLVGGLGTRLRSVVPSLPKPLAAVGSRPFLELLVRQTRSQGIRRLVMCTGHLADQVEQEFGDGERWQIAIEYSREDRPLGTAGAIKLAHKHLTDVSKFLVMNGDSFLEINLSNLLQFHCQHDGLVSMAVVNVENSERYGTVSCNSEGRVTGFREKTDSSGPALVNAGIYVFSHRVLDYLPEASSSLERDVFPLLLTRGVYAQKQHGIFIDIGTPEDYARAQVLSGHLAKAAVSQVCS